MAGELAAAHPSAYASGGAVEDYAELLGVVERIVRRTAGERAEDLLAELAGWVQRLGRFVYDDVTPPRPEGDEVWERQLEECRAIYRGRGAVHLEQGTWTAFPDERIAERVAAEGYASFIRLDFDVGMRPDVGGDVARLPFADESIDTIASNSLYEHIHRPHDAIAESLRVLRPGGLLEIVAPFHFSEHGCPDDYLRYTPSFLERVALEAGFEVARGDMYDRGGVFYTLHSCLKAAAADTENPDAATTRALHQLALVLLAPLAPLDRAFRGAGRNWFVTTKFFARKRGAWEPRQRRHGNDLGAFADLLACPETHGRLRPVAGGLLSRSTGVRHPIIDGIPDFTTPASTARLTARRWAARQLHKLADRLARR